MCGKCDDGAKKGGGHGKPAKETVGAVGQIKTDGMRSASCWRDCCRRFVSALFAAVVGLVGSAHEIYDC